MTACVSLGQCVSLVSMAYVHLVLCQYSASLWLQHIMSLVSFTAQYVYCLSLWLHVSIVSMNSTVCVYLVFMTVYMCHMSPWLQCMCQDYDNTVRHLSRWLRNISLISKCAHHFLLMTQCMCHLSLWQHNIVCVSLVSVTTWCVCQLSHWQHSIVCVSLVSVTTWCMGCLLDSTV